jgi:cell wall-associated NlpC family hydrolase
VASGSSVISIARSLIGVPYVYGGTTPSGFDCSGFTSYVYSKVGITLSHSSAAQRNAGTVVSRSQARPGDLIWTPGHVALYAGGNMQIDAPKPGGYVSERPIWQDNPTFIRVG